MLSLFKNNFLDLEIDKEKLFCLDFFWGGYQYRRAFSGLSLASDYWFNSFVTSIFEEVYLVAFLKLVGPNYYGTLRYQKIVRPT